MDKQKVLAIYGSGSTAATGPGMAVSSLTNYDAYGNQRAGASLTPTSNPYGYDGYYTDNRKWIIIISHRGLKEPNKLSRTNAWL